MSPSFSFIRQCMLTLILSLSFACNLAIAKPPYFTYRSLEPPETCVNPVKYNSFEEFDSYVIETLSCGINCRSYKPPTSQNVYELLAAISHLWEKPLPAESWTLSNGQGYEYYTGLRITQLAKLFSRIETGYSFATHINSCQKNLVLKAIETSIDKPGFVQLSNAYRAIALGRLVSKIFFLSRILLQEPTIYDNPDKYESLFNLLAHWLLKYNQKTNYGYPDYEVVRQM